VDCWKGGIKRRTAADEVVTISIAGYLMEGNQRKDIKAHTHTCTNTHIHTHTRAK